MSSQQGFTLLGVVVAVGFALTVVVAIAGLTVRTVAAARASRERFIATGLAREGVELVRSLRDSNWFSYPPGTATMKWRGDPGGTVDEQRRAICNGTWMIDVVNPRLAPLGGSIPNGELFLSGVTYSHDARAAPTIYRRRVMVGTAGTRTGNCGEAVTAGQATPPDPFVVTVTVEWRERADVPFRVVTLHSEFTDWLALR